MSLRFHIALRTERKCSSTAVLSLSAITPSEYTPQMPSSQCSQPSYYAVDLRDHLCSCHTTPFVNFGVQPLLCPPSLCPPPRCPSITRVHCRARGSMRGSLILAATCRSACNNREIHIHGQLQSAWRKTVYDRFIINKEQYLNEITYRSTHL